MRASALASATDCQPRQRVAWFSAGSRKKADGVHFQAVLAAERLPDSVKVGQFTTVALPRSEPVQLRPRSMQRLLG